MTILKIERKTIYDKNGKPICVSRVKKFKPGDSGYDEAVIEKEKYESTHPRLI